MIDGIATFTIVASTMIIATPIVSVTRPSQRFASVLTGAHASNLVRAIIPVVTPPSPQPGLPQRTVRGGAHMVVHVSRRTIDVGGSDVSPLQRIGLLLLLVPLAVIVFALGAVVLAVLLVAGAIVAAALAVAALVVRHGIQRGR
jgi:hypothetical protein